jgi:uncharacterized protein
MNCRMKCRLGSKFARILAIVWAFTAVQAAAKLPEGCLPPARERVLVADLADLLSDGEEAQLNAQLLAFLDTTSNAIAVVTHPDFCGLEPYEFATEAGENWGVGRADLDNGVVIAIKPRKGSERGQIFVAVGRGLEGAIPDIVAQISVDQMTPNFVEGRWLRGLQAGLEVLMPLAAGEISVDDYLATTYEQDLQKSIGIFVMFLIFMVGLPAFAIITSVRRKARVNDLGFWAALALVMASSGRHRGRYNHFTHGTGGFGGSGFGGSGGGFGGFGGGSFGGGGAGGSF